MSDPTPTTSAERGDDITFANADEAVAYLGSEWVKAQAERVAALEAVAEAARAVHNGPIPLRGPDTPDGRLVAALATLDEHA